MTTPVFVLDGQHTPTLVGSGVVVGAGKDRFLLTASHVVDQPEPGTLVAGFGNVVLPIVGQVTRISSTATAAGSKDDRVDIAAIRLADTCAEEYPTDAVIPLASLELDPEPNPQNPVLVCGYPHSRNRRALVGDTFGAKSYSLITFEIDLEAYAGLGLARDTQLGLGLDRKDVWAVDGKRTAPDLYGMSGGGAWRLPLHENRSVANAKLAALITEHHQKAKVKHMVATRVSAIVTVLADQYPLLRRELAEIGVRVA